MSSEKRQQRVRGLLMEELTLLVGGELEDPKLSLVTVTDVVVSKDLRNVRVYVNHQDESVSKKEVLGRLTKAAPYMRGVIGERLQLRAVPEINFEYDESSERATRLTDLLQQLAAERTAAAATEAASGAASGAATEAATGNGASDGAPHGASESAPPTEQAPAPPGNGSDS